MLEELPLMAKLRFVKSTSKVPKAVAADIERLNALRNGLAHAFLPENLKKSKPEWKGKKIFALDGLRAFLEDMAKLNGYFLHLAPEELDIFRPCDMPLVFQYGSNCDRERLNNAERLNGNAVDLGLVQTVGEYEIAFNKWSTRGRNAAADLARPGRADAVAGASFTRSPVPTSRS